MCRYEPIEALGTSCLLIAAPGGVHAVEVDGPVRNLATHPASAPVAIPDSECLVPPFVVVAAVGDNQ